MKNTRSILVHVLTLVALATAGCAEETIDEPLAASESSLNQTSSWRKLGEQSVDGRSDRDVVTVGVDDGRFDSIQLRVEGGSLEVSGVKIVFGNGEVVHPVLRHVFDEDSRSRVIDLPGNTRFITRVEFQYGNLGRGDDRNDALRARVQLWGRHIQTPPAWRALGERRVNGRVDRDTIAVGREEGAFGAIQIRVNDSALVMDDIDVVLGNGEVYRPQVRLVFDEGSRSRIIQLPGDRRFIQRVNFRYGNLPAGGDARVTLWATR